MKKNIILITCLAIFNSCDNNKTGNNSHADKALQDSVQTFLNILKSASN